MYLAVQGGRADGQLRLAISCDIQLVFTLTCYA